MKVALESGVASAGVMFAKKAGLPQLLAGSIKSQGVEFPPHSKFVVFTALALAIQVLISSTAVPAASKGGEESDLQGMTTSRSCMQIVLSYFAFLGCA